MYGSKIIIAITALAAISAASTPVVIPGKELPHLLGKPIASIRVLDMSGKAIPFQIDEVTKDGEYVLDKGEIPNVNDGNGILDPQDEIVFLWDDADNHPDIILPDGLVQLNSDSRMRYVAIRADTSIPLSTKRYIEYNHATQRVSTPYYYADFARDRFHFLRAGVKDFDSKKFIDLTYELRVEILLKTLFGLVPIRYTEDNMVCFVRRYKSGPIRLIRRGDFHLNLGLGVKGSRAAVNQICYPQIVKVPVHVSLPIRFRTLFSRAHIEMTPVIRQHYAVMKFKFSVPSEGISIPVSAGRVDTLHLAGPVGKMFTLADGNRGYGWLLNTTMDPAHLDGSGFVLRRPPQERPEGRPPSWDNTGAAAECGFRLAVRDVPKGNYYITNWVVFSGGKAGDIERLGAAVNSPVGVQVVKGQ